MLPSEAEAAAIVALTPLTEVVFGSAPITISVRVNQRHRKNGWRKRSSDIHTMLRAHEAHGDKTESILLRASEAGQQERKARSMIRNHLRLSAKKALAGVQKYVLISAVSHCL